MKYPSGYKNLNQINFNIREYYSFIGNIRKNKNLSLFISLVESFPNKKFLIAGSGDLGESKHRINNLENLDIINRFLSDEEYKLLIKKSLYVFLPYKYTTQSAIVIDSFMYGVPVISSKEGLFNEIINNGHNSYSFEITNYVKNAFEVIKNFDLKHYKIICKNCLEYYNNNHTFEIFQSKIKKNC